jgi:hypothetical protein
MRHTRKRGAQPRRRLDRKVCVVCGRVFEYRARWARDWANVRHCSRRCSGRRLADSDRALERAILDLLSARAPALTICPSEAARLVFPHDWKHRMEETREAARRLAARELIAFRQKGRRVDPSRARGALRLGRGEAWQDARSTYGVGES